MGPSAHFYKLKRTFAKPTSPAWTPPHRRAPMSRSRRMCACVSVLFLWRWQKRIEERGNRLANPM